MVRMKNSWPETRTTYYLKPGQTLQNTKVSERSLALIIPESSFERITDYAKENERVALLAEREAKRLATLKEASYNMSKSWEDTAKNIQKRRREELLSRKKNEDAERMKFIKELAAKNAEERAEIVRQAEKMILCRKPQCRLIDQALLTAECLRELNEQVKFQHSLKDVNKKLSEEQARWVMEDVGKFREEEKKRHQEKLNKIRVNKENLEKQMEKNKQDLKRIEESIRKAETEDLQNMSKEIDDIKQNELQEALRKKERLKKMFLENIEERRQCESKARQEDEFQEKSLKVYREFKEEMEKTAKQKAKNAKEEKARKIELLAKKIAVTLKKKDRVVEKQEKKKAESDKQLEEQRKQEELERLEEKKRKKEKARQELEQQLKSIEDEQEKRKKEEVEMRLWETLQRYKRDEFNKEWKRQHEEEEKTRRLEYGKILKKQMAQKAAAMRKEKIEEDDSVEIKEMINKVNEKVLSYGEQVLQESRGVRPTFPIEKAIEKLKRDVGLVPRFNKRDPNTEVSMISKRRRQRRAICPKPVDEEKALYLG